MSVLRRGCRHTNAHMFQASVRIHIELAACVKAENGREGRNATGKAINELALSHGDNLCGLLGGPQVPKRPQKYRFSLEIADASSARDEWLFRGPKRPYHADNTLR